MYQSLNRLSLVTLALACFAATAVAQVRPLTVPPDLQLTIMIRTTLIAFNHANQTGNYSVLRDLGSPSFREANTQARLAEIFHDERARNVDLSAIAVLQPKLLQPAAIDGAGRLVLVGLFESEPEQVQFTIGYEAVEGVWRLYALGVRTGPAPAPPALTEKNVATEKKPDKKQANETAGDKKKPKK